MKIKRANIGVRPDDVSTWSKRFSWRSFEADAGKSGPGWSVLFWRVNDHRRDAGGRRLKLDLLGNIQCIIYLNPEISDGALQFRMAQEKLNCA